MDTVKRALPPHFAAHSPVSSPFAPACMSLGEQHHSSVPLDFVYGLDDFGVYQGINLGQTPNALLTTATGSSCSSSSSSNSPSGAEDQNTTDPLVPHLINATLQHNFKNVNALPLLFAGSPLDPEPGHPNTIITTTGPQRLTSTGEKVKRRMQNREAQRRFRERKEERQKSLQQKAEDLQANFQKLSDQYTKRSDEVCELLKENDSLKSEIASLRQRWRIMMAVLQRPRGGPPPAFSPSSLLGESPPSASPSSSSTPSLCSQSTRTTKGLDLDDFWRCLEELAQVTSSEDKPHSPS